MTIWRRFDMSRLLAVCSVLAVSAALMGCHSDPPVDVSKGSYGKADTVTQLPPQPNVQEIIKKHQQGGAASGGAAVPSSGSSAGH